MCYCLMPNHFHFLIRQNSDIGIDRLITKVCTSYAMYFNKKYEKVGNLFQDAFKAKLVDNDSYLTYLSAYIHNNPVNVELYPYSSFPDYCGVRSGQICEQQLLLGMFDNDRQAYKKFVLGYNPDYENKIQHCFLKNNFTRGILVTLTKYSPFGEFFWYTIFIMNKETIFSGVQPSGRVHIGNYLGALANFVTLQNSGNYDCFFTLVDYHSISEDYEPKQKRGMTLDLLANFLAAGLDPKKSTILSQSQIPEHTELAWIFNCITPVAELERMTQYKDKSQKQVKNINIGV